MNSEFIHHPHVCYKSFLSILRLLVFGRLWSRVTDRITSINILRCTDTSVVWYFGDRYSHTFYLFIFLTHNCFLLFIFFHHDHGILTIEVLKHSHWNHLSQWFLRKYVLGECCILLQALLQTSRLYFILLRFWVLFYFST